MRWLPLEKNLLPLQVEFRELAFIKNEAVLMIEIVIIEPDLLIQGQLSTLSDAPPIRLAETGSNLFRNHTQHKLSL